MSEVTKVYPPLTLRVFVDDIKAYMNVVNKELAETAEKVLEEVEERGGGGGPAAVDH